MPRSPRYARTKPLLRASIPHRILHPRSSADTGTATAREEAEHKGKMEASPVLAIERANDLIQSDVLKNFNLYLSSAEQMDLEKLIGAKVPRSPAHIVTLANAKNKRVRLANIIEQEGDGVSPIKCFGHGRVMTGPKKFQS